MRRSNVAQIYASQVPPAFRFFEGLLNLTTATLDPERLGPTRPDLPTAVATLKHIIRRVADSLSLLQAFLAAGPLKGMDVVVVIILPLQISIGLQFTHE